MASVLHAVESKVNVEVKEGCTSTNLSPEQNLVCVHVRALEEDSWDVELGNFFLEDASSSEVLLPEVVNLQKKRCESHPVRRFRQTKCISGRR